MAVTIKRYANRKLYNTDTSRYITLKGIADLLEEGQEVRVVDNETGEDITSITLSQILVDTERSNRTVPGTVLSELVQRGGDVLYAAIRRGMGDASEGLEEFQKNLRRLIGRRDREGKERRDWVAFATPDLDQVVQGTMERVMKLLDLPRRSDVEALNKNLERVLEALEQREGAAGSEPPPGRPPS